MTNLRVHYVISKYDDSVIEESGLKNWVQRRK
jgi:hypothetical protein